MLFKKMRWSAVGALLLVAGPVHAETWTRSWEAGMMAAPASLTRAHPAYQDRTLRELVRLSIGGDQLRIRLSNEETPTPTRIGAVHVARIDAHGMIIPSTDHVVRFNGEERATIGAESFVVSDPVNLKVEDLDRIAVSMYFPDEIAKPTYHDFADATHWFAVGNQTAATILTEPTAFTSSAVLSGVDVESNRPRHSVVAFGDSITDGARATPNADQRWPDLLAERLHEVGIEVGVANAGIGGNQLLRDGSAKSGLARFERDALDVPGVSHIIVLEGVNDLGLAVAKTFPMPTAEEFIAGYRQMIAKAHSRGIKLILATLTPYKGSHPWTGEGEQVREAVNTWIRENKEADGFVDFGRAVASPADPFALSREFDSGDKLHPNDYGFVAMANSIPLNLLQ
jgi:lysophospholipase L1-like esterase